MGCGCNKNKNSPEFRKPNQTNQQVDQNQNIFSKGIGMAKSFATAIASRGFTDNKVNKPTKQLRVLSCFGNTHQGGELIPCEHLKESKTEGKHFCGGCGCGDKPMTWLVAQGEEYSKLDYPKLNCPLNMPGFTNYTPSTPDESTSPITRKFYIENIDFNEVLKTPVSLPQFKPQTPPQPPPEQPETGKV
jgi:hypothetical protein